MGAILVGAHVVQSHLLLGASGLGLEEDRFPVAAFRTRMVLGSGQRRIGDDVGHDVRQFAVR